MRVHPHRKVIWLRVLGVIGFVIYINLCWSAAYWITQGLYPKIGIEPSEFVRGLVNSFLGFLIFFCSMFLLSRLVRPRHVELFQLLIDALKRIAKGDFSVKLDIKMEHQWGQLVENINHMAEQLNEMEQMRQEFISNVSHEIQSPLTSISGFARALRSEHLTREEQLHYLDIIETESKRLSKLSDNLLKLTSLEARQHPMERKRYRLDDQLRSIILACEPQWLEKGIELDAELEKVELVADEDMMSQVWTNLLGNSIKFTPQGGSISVRAHRVGGEVVVQVSDTGIGISREDQERIFERFFKADRSRNRAVGGSGLGLSIVKKIVDLHQGKIAVQSRPGEGTTFIITFAEDKKVPSLP
ncbi:HAMP domain-containing sensor histidine kinase [Brevibacillus borstelensis]|jgi:signal transduction histidine kinase|uniref:sensor histidine kinase n=1 Tax=Brevibacillus TaxID=55080 RepID=UPI00156256BB|nr:HAMP domain-containing sensor histidine kinase [Brevibacillus borstelensis]MBE5396015.1 two-component sensor histidine kinase [Brevibacillus borstelensis]MCM3624284.1 HAMP domain-containing histidine kinase [Brevibacillus borstelensis]MED1744935.1 HAMP domain-containing sensor histidine kinase [Brevibacillus borstelensis]MED1873819.1 HAMP domain-containing sensor histidine kinase [Brevibacillus borstelensis]WNF07167.1 HAMP domain-containing sensor histidine kinase [Brevibacillus borstelensi